MHIAETVVKNVVPDRREAARLDAPGGDYEPQSRARGERLNSIASTPQELPLRVV